MNSPSSTRPADAGARVVPKETEAAACDSSVLRRASEPGDYNTEPTRKPVPLPFPETSGRRRTGRGAPLVERAPSGPRRDTRRRPVRIGHRALRGVGRVEFHEVTLRSHQFASERFHVLLNSLFKVLFNFPSRYLSAIGLVSVFSLRWSLPPTLGCIPKQPDSEDA